jgi:hypothetical protein
MRNENPIKDILLKEGNTTERFNSEYKMGSKTFCEQYSCNTLFTSHRNIPHKGEKSGRDLGKIEPIIE